MVFSNPFRFPLHFLLLLALAACEKPKSVIATSGQPEVLHLWCGAPETDGITLGVEWSEAASFEFRLATDSLFRNDVVNTGGLKVTDAPYYLKYKVEGLASDTLYYYAVFEEGQRVGPMGSFRTFAKGPMSFQITLASCQRTGSEASIFRAMAAQDPLFFLQMGDYHYANIVDDCDKNFLDAYRQNWYSRSQNVLFQKTPFIYMWDDHDYGPNNSDASAPCRENAIDAYRRYIPHYPQAFAGRMEPVSQSFVAGRIRFVLTDLRSQKVRPTYRQCERRSVGTNFGPDDHLQWFFGELKAAKEEGQAVAWVNGIPFINHEGGPNYNCRERDNWGGYPEERERISNFIKEHDIPLFILSGDAHMSAIDDGSNSDYAKGGGASIPVFQAGPMHTSTSYKGGPYSHGYSAERYQYGGMRVTDEGGDEICIEWAAFDDRNEMVGASDTGERLMHRFCLTIRE